MAAIVLTQVYLATKSPPDSQEPVFIVQGSEKPIAINPVYLMGVGSVYNPDGTTVDVRLVYLAGGVGPIYVTESYTYIKLYIDGL
jgi:hypothetical protein